MMQEGSINQSASASVSSCGSDNSDDDGLTPMSILVMPGGRRERSLDNFEVTMMSTFKEMADADEGLKLKSPSNVEAAKPTKEDASMCSSGKVKFRDNCRVCGDLGSGLHYGISSCEGCKGFFKRSVQMKRQYKCRFYNNCAVNKKTRNSCQACRFNKCIYSGMNIDLVRLDRTPGNRRKRPFSEAPSSAKSSVTSDETTKLHLPSSPTTSTMDSVPCNSTGSITEKEPEACSPCPSHSSDNSSSISDSSNVVESHSQKKSDSFTGSQESPSVSSGRSEAFPELNASSLLADGQEPLPQELLFPQLPPDLHDIVTNIIKSKPNVVPSLGVAAPDEPILTSQRFMNVAYSELEYVVWFAKRQRGFNELYMNDRRQLLRNSFLAIILVRLSFRSKEQNSGKILFAHGMELSPDDALNVSQFPPVIINMNIELIDWFQSLKLDEVECGLLQTIILASDDADNLMDRPLVRRIQNTHLEALRTYSNIRFPHAPHRLASLLLRLPFVRKMALLCMDHFLLLVESGQLTMDQLTTELVTTS